MRLKSATLAGAVLAALASGLAACAVGPNATGPAPVAPTPTTTALAGSQWVMLTLDGAAPAEGRRATFAFNPDGQANGTTGCNRFFASWTVTGSTLTLSGAGMTRMACMGPVGAQEMRILELFDAAVTAVIDAEDRLVLTRPGGPVLVLARVPSIG